MQKVAFFLENQLVDSNGHKGLDVINQQGLWRRGQYSREWDFRLGGIGPVYKERGLPLC